MGTLEEAEAAAELAALSEDIAAHDARYYLVRHFIDVRSSFRGDACVSPLCFCSLGLLRRACRRAVEKPKLLHPALRPDVPAEALLHSLQDLTRYKI